MHSVSTGRPPGWPHVGGPEGLGVLQPVYNAEPSPESLAVAELMVCLWCGPFMAFRARRAQAEA